jgi:hypothetical protein
MERSGQRRAEYGIVNRGHIMQGGNKPTKSESIIYIIYGSVTVRRCMRGDRRGARLERKLKGASEIVGGGFLSPDLPFYFSLTAATSVHRLILYGAGSPPGRFFAPVPVFCSLHNAN